MSRPKRNFRLDRSVEWSPIEVSTSIDSIDVFPNRQVVYQIHHAGFTIPVFAYLRPETGKAMFFGQESLDRSNTILPLFNRWSWHVDLPSVSLIVLNDPSLSIHTNLGCCWSQGIEDRFAVEAMRDVVVAFCNRLQIPVESAILFGASAGGFWAMMTGAELGSRSIVVDCPQTDLFTWHEVAARDAMLAACYAGRDHGEVRQLYPDRLRVIDRFKALGKSPKKITFIENKKDVKHARTQWRPFFAEIAALPARVMPEIAVHEYDRLGDRGQTHTTMERPETVSLLSRLLSEV